MKRAMAAASLLSPFPTSFPVNSKSHISFKPKYLVFSYTSFSPSQILKKSYSTTAFASQTLTNPSSSSHVSVSVNLFNELKPYLRCSMLGNKLKIAVLLSGGVDSSVALRLLHAAGHDCTAFYLKIWFQEDYENFWSECPWDDDLKYAKDVCDEVDVPLEVVHLSDEYWSNVVSHIIEEYRSGRTPNPDVLCNTRIKFGAFLEAVESMKFDYIASGHYANITHLPDSQSILSLSQDMVKDQTYFLSHLSQAQIRRLLFPLGCIPKEEVRKLAKMLDLPNKDRKDSQGICFLGKVKFSEFVAKHIGEKEGILLEAETGDYLGTHRGFWFYTIGQRQGLRLPGGPWYVVEKDVHNNVVFVSRNYFSLDKKRRTFRVGSLKRIGNSPPTKYEDLRCKVRHGPHFHKCSITTQFEGGSQEEMVTVHLSEDDQGLAAGQFAAFYDNNICLGSGVILEAKNDKSFPICTKALEIAQMKDKSKLGKPVRIMNQATTDCRR